jgi:hypothetical protein
MRLSERAIAHVNRDYDAEKNSGRLLELLKDQADIARTKARGRSASSDVVDEEREPVGGTIGSVSAIAS